MIANANGNHNNRSFISAFYSYNGKTLGKHTFIFMGKYIMYCKYITF